MFEGIDLFKGRRGRGIPHKPVHTKGPVPADNRQYEVKKLTAKHRAMMRLELMGYSRKEIARELEVSEATVLNVLNGSLAKRELSLMQAALDGAAINVANEIKGLHAQSILVMKQILEDDEAPIGLRLKAAMDNLSRGGYSPIQRGSLEVNFGYTPQQIEEMKQRAIEAGARTGEIIDVRVEERKDESE